MATAVIDLEFTDLPERVEALDGFDQALVLLRVEGRPVGQALLSVSSGRIGSPTLAEELMARAGPSFWFHWLDHRLRPVVTENAGGLPGNATVAVCTRDRPDSLAACLDALLAMPDDGQELLVVDSCPSDDRTLDLTRRFPRLRYVRSARKGLNVARNLALRSARGEIVAFTDDDTRVDPNWLRALLKPFADPELLCATGLTMPGELATGAQEWFERLGGLGRGFSRVTYDSTLVRPLEAWKVGVGANMAFRRERLLECVGPLDELLDVGTPTLGGGDSEIFGRILGAGYEIVYTPEALVWHFHRRSWRELVRQLYGYEAAGFAVWTRALFVDRDLEALQLAWDWIGRESANCLRSLTRRAGALPVELIAARLLGATVGPWAYLYARATARTG